LAQTTLKTSQERWPGFVPTVTLSQFSRVRLGRCQFENPPVIIFSRHGVAVWGNCPELTNTAHFNAQIREHSRMRMIQINAAGNGNRPFFWHLDNRPASITDTWA
jgi:hypothetical protein